LRFLTFKFLDSGVNAKTLPPGKSCNCPYLKRMLGFQD
jgi:hypothetical protein